MEMMSTWLVEIVVQKSIPYVQSIEHFPVHCVTWRHFEPDDSFPFTPVIFSISTFTFQVNYYYRSNFFFLPTSLCSVLSPWPVFPNSQYISPSSQHGKPTLSHKDVFVLIRQSTAPYGLHKWPNPQC